MNVVAAAPAIVLIHGTVLVVAFVLTRLSARSALRRDPTDAATKLRSRRFIIGVNTAFVVVLVGIPTGLLNALDHLTTVIPVLGSTPAQPALFYTSVVFGPMLSGYVVVALATLPAWRQLKNVDVSARSAARNATRRYVVAAGPKLGLFLLAITLPSNLAIALGTASVFAVYRVASLWLTERLNDIRALDPDERDRLGTVADRGVPIRVMEARDEKQAQGFAVGVVPGSRCVYLTDFLFDDLSDERVRAIAEHELAHIQRGHLVLRGALMGLLVVGIAVTIANASVGTVLLAAAAGVPYWLVYAALARWTEYDADRVAASGESAAAMAGALDDIAERNLLPREQNFFDALASKHPSVERRTAKLLGR